MYLNKTDQAVENRKFNRAHQRWMLLRMQDIIMVNGDDRLDVVLDRNDFQAVANALKGEGFINNLPEYNEFCREPAR